MGEKVVDMVLKVDLQCPCCYKKVKKILCKFPQIRDQVFNEKTNTVRIRVVCCDPERIRDKLCCKGAKVIKSIDILDPPKPEKPKQPEKPKEPEKPKQPEKPKEPEKPKQPEKPKEPEKPKQPEKPKEPEKPPQREPICNYPPAFPTRTCCGPCSEGHGGGPCYFGFGVAPPPPPPPPQPQPCFDGYSYGYGYHDRPCHVTRCDYYFSEENPQSCRIM